MTKENHQFNTDRLCREGVLAELKRKATLCQQELEQELKYEETIAMYSMLKSIVAEENSTQKQAPSV